MSETPRIVIAGAGTIGCYVGGRLQQAGHRVAFLGRAPLGAQIAKHGLRLSAFDKEVQTLSDIDWQDDPSCLRGANVVLVAVKSGDTAHIGDAIARFAPTATVISLQNGVSNADVLRRLCPDADVRGAVVEFNVVQPGQAMFHQATSGGVTVQNGTPDCAKLLSTSELPVKTSNDIVAAQWGKLLVNLNNALNALSGLTLQNQLLDRNWRRLLAAQISETLQVLKAVGIAPARFTPLPTSLVPMVLRLPTSLFRRIASAMLTIDADARSSMQDDLNRRRVTEIDALQGEVLKLAKRYDVACPAITRVVSAIRAAEAAQKGPPGLDPQSLLG